MSILRRFVGASCSVPLVIALATAARTSDTAEVFGFRGRVVGPDSEPVQGEEVYVVSVGLEELPPPRGRRSRARKEDLTIRCGPMNDWRQP